MTMIKEFTSFKDFARDQERMRNPALVEALEGLAKRYGYEGFAEVDATDMAHAVSERGLGKRLLRLRKRTVDMAESDPNDILNDTIGVVEVESLLSKRQGPDPISTSLATMFLLTEMFDNFYEQRDDVERVLEERQGRMEQDFSERLESYRRARSVRIFRYLEDRLPVNLERPVQGVRGLLSKTWSGGMVLDYIKARRNGRRALGRARGVARRVRYNYKKAMGTVLVCCSKERRSLYRTRGLSSQLRKRLNKDNVRYEGVAKDVMDDPRVLSYLADEKRRLALELEDPEERERLFGESLSIIKRMDPFREEGSPSAFSSATGIIAARYEAGRDVGAELMDSCLKYAESAVKYVCSAMANAGGGDEDAGKCAHLINHVFVDLDAFFRGMKPGDSERLGGYRKVLLPLYTRFRTAAHSFAPAEFKAGYRDDLFR